MDRFSEKFTFAIVDSFIRAGVTAVTSATKRELYALRQTR